MKKWKEIIAGIGKDKLLLLAIAGILLLLCSVPDKKEEKKTVQEETTGSTAVSDSYAEEHSFRIAWKVRHPASGDAEVGQVKSPM